MKRSTWASGSGYVPSDSIGFCVARTRNGAGTWCVSWPIVTWPSCMTSSSALWTFAGARLISSASRKLQKTGPSSVAKPPVSGRKMRVPTRSAGTRSGVNCRRLNDPPSTSATVLTVSVLARPGTPSSSTWPPASSATSTRSSIASWPTITRLISNSAVSSASCASRDGFGSLRESTARSRRSSCVTYLLLSAARRFRPGPEVHCEGTASAAAFDRHLRLLPGLALGHDRADVLRGGDLLVVDGDDLVAGLQARLLGGRAGDDRVHHRAGTVLRGHVAHAQIGALDLAAGLDPRDDELHGVHGYGEADAGVRVAAALDLGVHADHAAVAVQQRAAGVARVDRRVGLHRAGGGDAWGGAERAPERGDDAVRARPPPPEGGADGDRLIAR